MPLYRCGLKHDRSLATLSQNWIDKLGALWHTCQSICAACTRLVVTHSNTLGSHMQCKQVLCFCSLEHTHHHHHIKTSALWVPMQDNHCSSSPPFLPQLLAVFLHIIRPSLPFPPSLPSFSSFASYCLPAVLISAPLIFQPMNWSHRLYHSYCRLQPSLFVCSIFSTLSSSLRLSTDPLTGM